MAKTSDTQLKAIKKYDKEHTKTLLLKFNKKTDADILDALEHSGNKQGFIKKAIREYIKNRPG